jgi:hypothetical protein
MGGLLKHIQRRPPEASVRNGILSRPENTRKGRGRSRLTWEEAIKRDLKEWNIPKELALDRSAWKFMYLNHDLGVRV